MAQIADFVASITLKQSYRHQGFTAEEAEFRFPMDTEAAVNALEVRVGDRVITGRVLEKAAAKAEYSAAVAAGHGAYLVEESALSTDVFVAKCEWPHEWNTNLVVILRFTSPLLRVCVCVCAVGNVLPGQTLEVTVSYVSEVRLDGDELRFSLPVGIGSRYLATPTGNINMPPAAAVNIREDASLYGIKMSNYPMIVDLNVRAVLLLYLLLLLLC